MESTLSMERATQLAVSLVNRPGALAHICGALAKGEINIYALTVLDSWGDRSIVRTIVSDPAKALILLAEAGVDALETEVLMIQVDHEPGALERIAERLAKADVNIEYAYFSASPDAPKSLIILRPSDVDEAHRALRDL